MNKTLNAYVTVTADLARREAQGACTIRRGRLWGIPIAHKDLFETKGVRTTAGSLLYDDYIPDDNAAIVQQLERRRRGDARQDQHPRARRRRHDDQSVLRHDAQSGRSRRASPADRAADRRRRSSRICARRRPAATPAAACAFPRRSADASASSRPSAVQHAGPARRVPDLRSRRLPDAHRRRRADHVRRPAARRRQRTVASPRIAVARQLLLRRSRARRRDARSIRCVAKYPDDRLSRSTRRRWRASSIRSSSFEIWGRFGADWRTNPGSFSKDFAGFFSTPRPSIAEYEAALAALKEYQAAVDKLFDSRRRHRHADRPGHRAAASPARSTA